MASIILLSLGIMGYLSYWLVRHRTTIAFFVVVWVGYVIITVTGGFTVLYALQEKRAHWERFFTSTCQLFGSLVQSAGHDQIEFSYSLWSNPIHEEDAPFEGELLQPNPLYSTRPLDIPQQFQWTQNKELHWQSVPDATEYELSWFDSENEDWQTVYRGAETSFTPEHFSGWFCVRSLRVTPLDDPVYKRISQLIIDSASPIPDIASVYTLRDYSEKECVFIVCPEMDIDGNGIITDNERLAPPGETYPREDIVTIPPDVRTPIIDDNPVEDEWGIWFSATIALYRPDGTRDGYLGVDYPVEAWQQSIYQTQVFYSLFLFVVLVMYFFGVIQVTRLYVVSEKQKKTAKDLHHTVEELTEAKIVAESASRAKSYFLTNMGHEIRTPLNAVLGFAEIISRRLLECCPPDQLDDNQQITALIDKSSADLLTIINDILDFSQVDASQVEIEWTEIEPRSIMKDVYNVIAPKLHSKPGIAFIFDIEESVPKHVYSDPTRLRQILGNICGNAIKFSESGTIRFYCRTLIFDNTSENVEYIGRTYGPSVKTALFAEGTPINLLQFVVQDEGIGIPETLQTKLFQPFTQADQSLTRKFGGAGLGLAISKHLAVLMGGDIVVESGMGVGTTVAITFAIEKTSHASDHANHSGIVLLADVNKPLAGLHVLVVEDGKVNQMVLVKMLHDAGATCQVVENGQLGVEAVETSKQQFDVILMDMQMPVMDGYEATHRLRQNGFKKPIIAVTAHALTGDCEKTLHVGCNAYISKPVDRHKLFDMILKHSQQSFELQR